MFVSHLLVVFSIEEAFLWPGSLAGRFGGGSLSEKQALLDLS